MLQNLPKTILAHVGQRLLNPAEVIRELDIKPNWRVLELGLPVGYFAPALHTVLGDSGSMILAGPNEESLEKLHDEIEHTHTSSTTLAHVLAGDATEAKSLDLVILTNVLSNAARADNFCLSLSHYLKASAKVAVIDWDAPQMGKLTKEHAVSREAAIALLQKCGYEFERLLNLPGYHFGLVFRPNLS